MTDHTCKNCGNRFNGKFCNQCGEKVYTDKDRSVVHFIEEGFHFLTHFDGNFFTTLKAIFIRPGQLSQDYAIGVRKKYFKPLSLFLILVVLYLLFPLFTGLNMDAKYYPNQAFFGHWADVKIKDFINAHPGMTMDEFRVLFAAKSEKTSKFMLLILLPICAVPLWLMGHRKRPYFFDSLIYSTEFNNVFLIVGFFIIPVVIKLLYYFDLVLSLSPMQFERWVGIIEYTILILYLRRGLIRVYGMKTSMVILTTIVFIVWHILTVFVLYKYLLFVTVFYQLH